MSSLPMLNGFCNYNTRGRRGIHLNRITSKSGIRSFSYAAVNFFIKLPSSVRNSKSIQSFTSNYWLNKHPHVLDCYIFFICIYLEIYSLDFVELFHFNTIHFIVNLSNYLFFLIYL